ncbi:Transcriptional regulator, TetR family [Paenibacillus pasadenensis]|uniref:Transcriptional regulator, TetR family n=1 Tax=Paenibacillus pasadenensis TaxID=217090 RepID=A0A2N5N7F5_9BACL|nr:TetR-like C-terminal domain-containing protein [Paenibacillus pasadenensis]PLT46268.1 Transcriptional regulator, TetR family [Paenibacillus pasadenensis]
MPRIGLDRDTLLAAAAELADERGFEALALNALALKLGVRSPSLYNHVPGLPELRRLLAIRAVERLTATLEEAASRADEDAASAISLAYLAFARAYPGQYEAIQRAPEPDDGDLQDAAERLVQLIVRILSGYGLAEDELIHAVRGIRSLLHGFVSLERIGAFGMPQDRDASFRFMLQAYLRGLSRGGGE